MTATGMFVGTVDYIAPEQIEGKQIDGRADIYSLGCVLFQLLSGSVPFPRGSDRDDLRARERSATPPARRTGAACRDRRPGDGEASGGPVPVGGRVRPRGARGRRRQRSHVPTEAPASDRAPAATTVAATEGAAKVTVVVVDDHPFSVTA